MRFIIALYEIDRAYGGPEEGAWWYDTGELARLLALAPTETRAVQLADRANRPLGAIDALRPDQQAMVDAFVEARRAPS